MNARWTRVERAAHWRTRPALALCATIVTIITLGALAGCKGEHAASDTTTAATAAGTTASVPEGSCPGDNGGITLPPGFCATVFADSLGHVRHITVAPNGDVYVNTWSGKYYGDKPVHAGGFLVALRDSTHDGVADVVTRFGDSASAGGHGGTGIGLYKGALYAEEGPTIVKYAMDSGAFAPKGKPTIVVSGLPLTGDHPMHPFAIDSATGMMYIDLGTATNSCQSKNRTLEVPGIKPCTELETRGGIWQYDANKTGQQFSSKQRYATGIRNADGITFGPGNQLYATQHGRDQLAENWPKLYTPEQGQNLPAEELLKVDRGADYGWPECYFDNTQQKLVLAPEYGGDGGKAIGECANKAEPVAFFPAHWAPLGVTFYTGTQFPQHYQGGAFIAFHGSWNRAPGPQGGYNVVFVPFENGKPAAMDKYEVFADGFAGALKQPDRAAHRPAGVAVGPDGSLYVTDDQNVRVWRITYGKK